MKRFPFREFALLCAPLLLVAVVGFVLSRRKSPSPDEGKLRVEFRVEKPKVLEAFKGADAVLVVELKGHDAPERSVYSSDHFLEVRGNGKIERSFGSRGVSGVWTNVWQGNWNNTRFPIDSQAIPNGALSFSWTGQIVPPTYVVPAKPNFPRLSGTWRIDRSQIQPFPFDKMPRAPLVRLRSVRILQVNGKRNIRGKAVFDLIGAAMNDQTSFDSEFKTHGGTGMSSGYLMPQTATQRVREWTVYQSLSGSGRKQIVRVTGRVSADERWPLAFEFEPFDFRKAKAGQTLKFKSWPAPLPSSKKTG